MRVSGHLVREPLATRTPRPTVLSRAFSFVESRGGAGFGAVLHVPDGVHSAPVCHRFARLLLSALSKPAATCGPWHTQKALRDKGLCVRRRGRLLFGMLERFVGAWLHRRGGIQPEAVRGTETTKRSVRVQDVDGVLIACIGLSRQGRRVAAAPLVAGVSFYWRAKRNLSSRRHFSVALSIRSRVHSDSESALGRQDQDRS